MLLNNKKCHNCNAYYDPTLYECPQCHKENELYTNRQLSDSVMYYHPIAQIGLFLAGFSYVGMLVSGFIVALVPYGVDDNGLRGALVILFTYLLMLSALMTISFTSRERIFIKKFKRPYDYLFGLAYAGGIVLFGWIIGLITGMFYKDPNVNQQTAESLITNYPIIAAFVICILGPICEELTYRVGLYSFLRRIDKVLAFIVTVFVFALIHFDFMAENIIGELWSLPSYLMCGALLTMAYDHRGPACSILAHIAYNTTAFFAVIIGNIHG